MLLSWAKLAADTTMLAIEANAVIGLRATQLALGKGTPSETNLMATEKVVALVEAAGTVLRGGSANTVVRGYRKRVRANIRRLTRR